MSEEVDFIEQILKEAEAKEAQQRMAYYDLILIEMGKLQSQIERNFHQADIYMVVCLEEYMVVCLEE